MIGVMRQPCEQWMIDPEDKIVGVLANSDYQFLRSIQFRMASGEVKKFGTWDGKATR